MLLHTVTTSDRSYKPLRHGLILHQNIHSVKLNNTKMGFFVPLSGGIDCGYNNLHNGMTDNRVAFILSRISLY